MNSLPFVKVMNREGAASEVEVCDFCFFFFCFDRNLLGGGEKESKKMIRFKGEEKEE